MIFREWWENQPHSMTRRRLISAIGVSDATLHRWIRGESRPRGASAILLCAISGVEPGDWELDGGGAPSSRPAGDR